MKLTVKLPLIFIPLVAVPLLTVCALVYFQLKNYSEQRSIEEVSTLLSQTGTSLNQIIEGAKATAELISQDQQILNYLFIDDEEERYSLYQRPLEKLFVSIQNVFPEYVELRIMLPDGFEDVRVVNPYTENASEQETNTDYFQLMRSSDGHSHASLNINPDTNELALYISRKIELINPATDSFDATATLRGYLIITVDLGNWIARIENMSWKDGGGLILARPSGGFLAIGSKLNRFREDLKDELSHEVLRHQEDDYLRELSLPSTNFHHKYNALSSGLVLHALLPDDELVSTGRRITFLVTTILIIVLVVALPTLVMLLNVQVITPILRLRTALRKVGEGDSQISLPTSRKDEFGEVNNSFNQMRTELNESNERIRTLAYQDALTGLPNRLTFLTLMESEIALAKDNESIIALLFLDLDNFKLVNDTLGHEHGDRLLQDVAERLSHYLREYDQLSTASAAFGETSLARLGGDEFTILLSRLSSPAEAGMVAQRIIDLLAQPLELNGQSYYVGASIGVAMYPTDGSSVEELIKHADLSMYEAKKQGRNNYQYFSTSISEQSRKRAQLDQKLHQAIEFGAFELFYQPIIDCRTHRISYYEALIRWPDPELGYVPPGEFIPLSEENGTIYAIGDWVIEESVRQLKEWQSGDLGDVKISINVSGIQLSKPDFVRNLKRALRTRNISPESIIVELTETAVIKGKQDVIDTLTGLRNSGIRIALDDFGTGYSSLSHLKNLPIDILKIDRSFVSRIEDRQSAAILSAIIRMAHALDLEVVAEGVEEPGQAEFLKKEGCDYVQGYLFRRPEPASQISQRASDSTASTGQRNAGAPKI